MGRLRQHRSAPGGAQVCVDNGAAETLNADGPNKYKNPSLVTDAVRCKLPPLPVVTMPGRQRGGLDEGGTDGMKQLLRRSARP